MWRVHRRTKIRTGKNRPTWPHSSTAIESQALFLLGLLLRVALDQNIKHVIICFRQITSINLSAGTSNYQLTAVIGFFKNLFCQVCFHHAMYNSLIFLLLIRSVVDFLTRLLFSLSVSFCRLQRMFSRNTRWYLYQNFFQQSKKKMGTG